jgi:hypothetical protein
MISIDMATGALRYFSQWIRIQFSNVILLCLRIMGRKAPGAMIVPQRRIAHLVMNGRQRAGSRANFCAPCPWLVFDLSMALALLIPIT